MTRVRRAPRLVLMSGALLVLTFTGLGQANVARKDRHRASTLYVSAPSQVKVDEQYRITVGGRVPHREHLYLFFQPHTCLANPYAEGERYGRADIYIIHHRGRFEVKFNALRTQVETTWVCAYLVAPTIPVTEYSSAGVLAYRFKSTRVTST